ncbi:MAG TPA: sulfurtransferase TusA family protein [Gammaproteobacteria bacterium]|nr:sulfurtransferase TusA family protein [Gammaproteobacteria bacterium]
MSEQQLDARRLLCPLPVIRTQERVEQMGAGECLQVLCTDPGAVHDIPAWCRVHGHEVIEIDRQDGEIRIRIRVGED